MTQSTFEAKKPETEQLVHKGGFRNAARIIGILFIIATATDLLSTSFLGSVSSSNYLSSVSANGSSVLTGVLLLFIGALASASIAISLYPILKKYSERLALEAVGLRLIEAILYIVSAVALVSLLSLSQQFVKAGAPVSSYFQPLGVVLLATYNWVGSGGAVLAFGLGALMYYFIFYQTKLIPRWLSGWGLLGAVMVLTAGLLVMGNLIGAFSTTQIVLALPIAVQEMALAVWLIVKGFNPAPAVP